MIRGFRAGLRYRDAGHPLVPTRLLFPQPLEREFLRDYYLRNASATRLSLLGGLAIWMAFGALDYWLLPQTYVTAWVLRFGIVAPIFVFLIALSFTRLSRRLIQEMASTAMIVCGLGIALMIFSSDPEEPGRDIYFAGIILVHIGGYVFLNLRFQPATMSNLTILAVYEVGYLLLGDGLGTHESRIQFLSSNFFLVGANILGVWSCHRLELFARRDFALRRAVQEEQGRAEGLLLNILPEEIATELKSEQHTIARAFPAASVLFADIVDFTPITSAMAPDELIDLLNEVFSLFDSLVDKHDVEKVKTIGDCYMAAAGVPVFRPDHAHALARMALDVTSYAQAHTFLGHKLTFRIGINSGPVVAGVIGRKKFSYDLWGDAVNLASRMESHGREGCIQITRGTYELLANDFECLPLGSVALKGVGEVEVWQLVGETQARSDGAATNRLGTSV